MKLIVAPTAQYEIVGVWEFIARDNIDAADNWTKKLKKEFERIARYPQIGHVKWESLSTLRCWPFGTYLILYQVSGKTLTVMRVISGFRDISESDFGEI